MKKDLFGAVPVAAIPTLTPKTDFLERYRLSLRLDQAMVGMIVLLIIYVLVFSFGVETGKRYAMAELRAERAKRERMAQELGEKIFARTEEAPVQRAAAVSTPLEEAPEAKVPVKAGAVSRPIQPPAAVLPVQSQAGKFTIQLIAFNSRANAEKEVKRLAEKGFRAALISKGRLHQVFLPGFETRQKADQALKQLKAQGIAPPDAYIRNA